MSFMSLCVKLRLQPSQALPGGTRARSLRQRERLRERCEQRRTESLMACVQQPTTIVPRSSDMAQLPQRILLPFGRPQSACSAIASHLIIEGRHDQSCKIEAHGLLQNMKITDCRGSDQGRTVLLNFQGLHLPMTSVTLTNARACTGPLASVSCA